MHIYTYAYTYSYTYIRTYLLHVLPQGQTLKLFDEFVTADGRGVDFARMASSRALVSYLTAAARLSCPSVLKGLADMSR